jgi:hypothetical protein
MGNFYHTINLKAEKFSVMKRYNPGADSIEIAVWEE